MLKELIKDAKKEQYVNLKNQKWNRRNSIFISVIAKSCFQSPPLNLPFLSQ